MSDATERENAIFLAGQVIGMALRCSPATWRDAAEAPGLDPACREAIRLLAQFREDLREKAGH